jgi:tetratricopeptide (TPR) repeat protein
MKTVNATFAVKTAVLVALSLAVYWPTLQAGFTWDDDAFVINNPLIRAADGLYRFWLTAEAPGYFPLTCAMLRLKWRLWEDDATGYHAVNLALHIIISLLVWRLLERLQVPGAWLVGLVFAVHPVNVATVAWITERKNTLPMVVYLAAFIAWLKSEDGGQWRWYALALAFFLAALLAKTSVVMLPVVLLGLAWWRHGTIGRNDILRALPFSGLALAMGLVTLWFQSNVAIGATVVRTDGAFSRLAIAGMAVWFYLYKALLPVNLILVYPRWDIDPASPQVYLPTILLALCLAVLYRRRSRWGRGPLFALGYFVVSLFPVLGFFNIYFMKYSLVADHWQYVAIVGPIGFVAAGAARAWSMQPVLSSRWGQAAAGAILMVLAVLSWNRTWVYQNQETQWQDTIAKNPKAAIAYINLGMLRENAGKTEESRVYFFKALAADLRSPVAHHNVGIAKQAMGNIAEAQAHFREAVRLDPGFSPSFNNLGMIAIEQGCTDEAIKLFAKAVGLNPRNALYRSNLAVELARKGKVNEAMGHFSKALAANPQEPMVHYNLGVAMLLQNQPGKAKTSFERALHLDPSHYRALTNLGILAARQGSIDQALGHYRQAIGIRPDHVPALINLGAALVDKGQLHDAIGTYEKALDLSPCNPMIRNNLGIALLRLAKPGEAVQHFQQAVDLAPEYVNARFNLAKALVESGRAAGALPHLETVRQKAPASPEVYHYLFKAFWITGDRQAARQHLETLRTLAPQLVQEIEDWAKATSMQPGFSSPTEKAP